MPRLFLFFVASSLLSLCLAGPLAPLEPAPGETCTEGGPLHLSWTPDTTGAWKETTIELMTGANLDMVHLTTLLTIDGTNPTNTSITVPCPFVTPHSAIYFLQFSSTGGAMWTGRITILGPDGASVPPANPTQPDGSNIPWGTGSLIPPSFPGSPPPSTAPSGQVDASNVNGAAAAGGGGSSNSTEGLNASNSSSSSSSSVALSTGATSSGFSRSSSAQPTSAFNPDTPTTITVTPTTTTSSGTANANSAVHTITPFVSGFSSTAITILMTTFTMMGAALL